MSSQAQPNVALCGDINVQETVLAYYASLVRSWLVPAAAALLLATVQFLVLRRDVLVFSAAVLLAFGFGALVIRSGRRSATNVLRGQSGTGSKFYVVAVPPGFGLWRLAGGTGRGGWLNEWVLMTSNQGSWLARGTAEHQVRVLAVEIRGPIATPSKRVRLVAADRSCVVRVRARSGR